MKEKFNNISVEKDTKILETAEITVDSYDAVIQKWCWDGIYGESLIFFNEDISELNEDQVKSKVQESDLLYEGSQMTFKKGEIYTFVNFNFAS